MRRVVIVAFLLAAACATEPTAVVEVKPGPSGATLKISLLITGDSSMIMIGNALYSVHVDDSTADIAPGQTRVLNVNPGTHSIALTRFVGGLFFGIIPVATTYAPWCDPIPPLTITDSVAPGETRDIAFVVNCPSREGNGIVRLNLGAIGEHVPDSAQVYLLSELPGRKLTPVVVATRAVTDISLSAGAYQLGIDVPSCAFPSGPYSAIGEPFVLHAGAVKQVSVTLPCR